MDAQGPVRSPTRWIQAQRVAGHWRSGASPRSVSPANPQADALVGQSIGDTVSRGLRELSGPARCAPDPPGASSAITRRRRTRDVGAMTSTHWQSWALQTDPLRTNPNPPARAPRHLLGQIASVARDVPAFLTAPLYRRWHRCWGATSAEVEAELPGDSLVPNAQFRATRAITINASPESVWPWLVQVGCLRAGFYSNDLLGNLAHPSADRVIAELQDLEVGQRVPMSPTPTERTTLRVRSYETNRWLLWTKSDSTWAWQITPIGHNGTRLITRIHARYDWHHPLSALVGVVLMEFGDFAMLRRMLRGIKSRAESLEMKATPEIDGSNMLSASRPSPNQCRSQKEFA